MELETLCRGKQCSYCDRSFSRSEHLSRHERSHRNERPYQCTSCNATFSRQDTFKRHQSRYHRQRMANSPQQQSPEGSPTVGLTYSQSRRTQPGSLEADMVPAHKYRPCVTGQPLVLDSTELLIIENATDFSIPDFSFPLDSAPAPFGEITQIAHDDLHTDLTFSGFSNVSETDVASAPASQITDPSAWKGSFAISVQKHHELNFEVSMVVAASPDTMLMLDPAIQIQEQTSLSIPSRFTLERLISTFVECLLVYIPCIHTPTWKAEEAPPCLIFAMASIGAEFYDDIKTCRSLHRIARASLRRYVENSPHTIANEPLWVLQCILLVMFNGTKSANFEDYQEATSLVSLLTEGVRYRKSPSCAPQPTEGGQDPVKEWYKWIEFEATVRTFCAIYIYLNCLSVTFQTTNGLSNLEMGNCFLPCDESQWMCATPKAWLESRQSNFKPPVQFATAMKSLFSPQFDPQSDFSTFGSYVMLHGLVKQLASLQEDVWLQATTPTLVHRLEQALQRWQTCSTQNPEFNISPRYPNGVIPANARSLYRHASIRLCAGFGAFRSTLATRDVEAILHSLKEIQITICSSDTSLRAAQCALEALQVSVRMGLFLTGPISGWHRKLMFNLHSLESCVFLSFWIREQLKRSALDRSFEEDDLVGLTQETLTEANLELVHTAKQYSIQVVYAWALVFERCNASGLHSVVAEVLKRYADSLTE